LRFSPISDQGDRPAPLVASGMAAVMNGMSAIGFPMTARRSVARLMGYRVLGAEAGGSNAEDEVADCHLFVSVKDVCDIMKNQRWDELNVALFRRALRRAAIE